MNLYEYEGKEIFDRFEISIPKGRTIFSADEAVSTFDEIGPSVVLKAQVLSGKRGKAGAILFSSDREEVSALAEQLFEMTIGGQGVVAVRMEEKLNIASEHYLSITYDTKTKQPVCIYSAEGGMDIEDVPEEQIQRLALDVRSNELPETFGALNEGVREVAQQLWTAFLESDARLVEINPLADLADGGFVAADAKIALDDDAFFRHEEWQDYPERTMMGRAPTQREIDVKTIDEGEGYYRGTAGKYVELDGDIAVLFSGGGASIANMDMLMNYGLKPANYTEYSGNPPREKVAALAKIVLSKPGLRGLWIAGGAANFTDVEATFQGIVDALDEVKPSYPIVIRRAGPREKEGMALMEACAERNGLNMQRFGKEVSMSETAKVLADAVK